VEVVVVGKEKGGPCTIKIAEEETGEKQGKQGKAAATSWSKL